MAIIKLYQGQPELAVRLTAPGPARLQLAQSKGIRLVITAAGLGHAPGTVYLSPLKFTGFWPGRDSERYYDSFIHPDDRPALVYPAFTTDDQSRVVFKLDSKLWKMPPGRYLGHIETESGQHLANLDLDLCVGPFLVEDVNTTVEACGA